jgi:hypothetical protein
MVPPFNRKLAESDVIISFLGEQYATMRHSPITITLRMVSHMLLAQCDKTQLMSQCSQPNNKYNNTWRVIVILTRTIFFSDTNAALFCNLYHNHLWDMFLQVLTCTLTISLILVLTSILTHLLKYILTYSLTSFVTNSLANLLTVWHTVTLPLTFILIVSLIILLIMLFANISIFWQVPVPIARATSCRRHWCTLTGGE